MDGIVVVLVLALIFGPFVGIGFGIGWVARGRRDRKSLALGMARYKRQDALVDQIQRDAYEHMVLEPTSPLPVIIIDSIRNSEADERREVAVAGVQPMTVEPSPGEAAKRPFISLTSHPGHPIHPARPPVTGPVAPPVGQPIAPPVAPRITQPPTAPDLSP